jgi:alkylated DNA repair protein alkB family protein 6
VCTVSLGASLCLDLYRAKASGALDPAPAWRVLQEPRSLLVTTGALYADYLHGIADVAADDGLGPGTVANWDLLGDRAAVEAAGGRSERGLRTSLTYRDVRRVVRVGAKLGGVLFGKKG